METQIYEKEQRGLEMASSRLPYLSLPSASSGASITFSPSAALRNFCVLSSRDPREPQEEWGAGTQPNVGC